MSLREGLRLFTSYSFLCSVEFCDNLDLQFQHMHQVLINWSLFVANDLTNKILQEISGVGLVRLPVQALGLLARTEL